VRELSRNGQRGAVRFGRQVSAVSLIGGLAVGILGAVAASSWLHGQSEAPPQESRRSAELIPRVVELTEDVQRSAGVSTVTVSRDRREAMVVPAAALQLIDDQSVVFVRTSSTRFESRNVQVRATVGDRVEVRGALSPGDAVVNEGSSSVKTALLRVGIAP
jgi:hypothetical protein